MHGIEFSPKTDINIANMNDIAPERLLKLFAYELPNTSKAQAFVEDQGFSLAYITQDNLDKADENLKPFYYIVENGVVVEVDKDYDDTNKTIKKQTAYYFEVFAAMASEIKLDISTSTSTLGQELKQENSFTTISNWSYQGELEAIKVGRETYVPAIFTVGLPYNQSKYEINEQSVFIASSIIEAKQGRMQYHDQQIDTEGLYELELVNITAVETSFTNARIMFVNDQQFHNPSFISGQSPVLIGFENHMLLNSIKAKGTFIDTLSSKASTEFGNIDFIINEPITPIKFTPTSTTDKLIMYADWFDYNTVLPWVYAEKFTSDKTNFKISQIITDADDRTTLIRMLLVSAGFADSWEKADRLTSGGDAGKIDPKFLVGGLKVQAFSGKDPMKVVDGIYESHIRNNPRYNLDIRRQRLLRGCICSLSRYITSSYAVGKGQNAFNSLYLPWYLTPRAVINYAKDGTGDIEVYTQTNYFSSTYSSLSDFSSANTITLPSRLNISQQVLLFSDRPTSLPELPYQINAIDKLTLPGDVNIQTSTDLEYIFYTPVDSNITMERMYIDTPDADISTTQTNRITPPDIKQKGTLSMDDARSILRSKYQGYDIIKDPTLKPVDEFEKTTVYPTESSVKTQTLAGGQNLYRFTYTYPDGSSYTHDGTTGIALKPKTISISTRYTIISDAIVEKKATTVVKDYNITRRQLEFDKNGWEQFLFSYGIIPDTAKTYSLDLSEEKTLVRLDEITISSVWGNYIDLKIGASDSIRIQLFNSIDETIGVQKILFT